VIISIILIISGIYFSPETTQFFQESLKIHSQKQLLQKTKVQFSQSDVLSGTGDLLFAPSKEALSSFLTKISSAKNRIFAEVYILTEKRIISEFCAAQERGVDVRVILEGQVYGFPAMNKTSFNKLSACGVKVVYADNLKFTFTHSKFLLLDNSFMIGTGNFSHSAFVTNREIYFFGTDFTNVKSLEQIFFYDFDHKQMVVSLSGTLLASPDTSRTKIETALRSAKKEILLYMESLSDKSIMSILVERARAGVDIQILLGYEKNRDEDKNVQALIAAGVRVRSPKKPYIHAKAVLIDQKTLYLGSVNFTANSLDNNREIGVLFNPNSNIQAPFVNTFKKDFSVGL